MCDGRLAGACLAYIREKRPIVMENDDHINKKGEWLGGRGRSRVRWQ